MKNQNLFKKFSFTRAGLKKSFSSEHSLKIELFISILGLLIFGFFQFSFIWCSIYILASIFMLTVELINTSVELFLDHFHPQFNATVGSVKDILSAAAFLSQLNFFTVIVFFILSQFI